MVFQYQNIDSILFVDSTIKDYNIFVNSVNSYTFPIVYSYDMTQIDILDKLKQFNVIKRIGIVCHGSKNMATFLNNEKFSSNDNIKNIIEIINLYQVSNIDFLACNTLKYDEWNNYYKLLESKVNKIIIGASSNNTGNINYGGTWILEKTNENIQYIYFTDNILKYNDILASVAPATPTNFIAVQTTPGTNDGNYTLTWVQPPGGSTVTNYTITTIRTINTKSNLQSFNSIDLNNSVKLIKSQGAPSIAYALILGDFMNLHYNALLYNNYTCTIAARNSSGQSSLPSEPIELPYYLKIPFYNIVYDIIVAVNPELLRNDINLRLSLGWTLNGGITYVPPNNFNSLPTFIQGMSIDLNLPSPII